MRRPDLAICLVLLTALALGGCTYNYLQHTDRVSYRAGNAVRHNMAIQTTNPSSGGQFVTSGLGGNGNVIPSPNAPAAP